MALESETYTPVYRSDIDGLRAVAVLSVLFYHVGFNVFSGGYVGVDIFFVISGFLITTIIMREIVEGTFSITTFYERRFRRILPAATVVVAVSLVAGYLLFDANKFAELAKSSIAHNLFLSNFYFFMESGYFDAPAEMKPLLHTWSLSVEEQYYVIFPLILLAIAKFGKGQYLRWLSPLLLLSFGVCAFGTYINQSAVFYMLPTRAWELLIGSLLAIGALPKIQNNIFLNFISIVGLALMGYSIFGFTSATIFPGAWAAVPACGAALVIYAGSYGSTLVNRILALKPMVFVGLISYSLYLWHWPLIVFFKYFRIVELTLTDQYLLISITFILSYLCWHFIETPFRKKLLLPDKRSIYVGSAQATMVLLALSLTVVYSDGLPKRFQFLRSAYAVASDPEWRRWAQCEKLGEQFAKNGELCKIGKLDGTASFILWGDSHARSLASGVDESALRHGETGVVATSGACPPLRGIERPSRRRCYEFNQTIIGYIETHPEINTIILVARWAISVNGTRYKSESGKPVNLVDFLDEESGQRRGYNHELVELGLLRTVQLLQDLGRRVIIVKPVPEIGYDVPAANHIALITNRDANSIIAPTTPEFMERNGKFFAIFSRLQKQLVVETVDPSAYLCDDYICNVITEDGNSLYRDDDHLSTFGSRYVSRAFDAVFEQETDEPNHLKTLSK